MINWKKISAVRNLWSSFLFSSQLLHSFLKFCFLLCIHFWTSVTLLLNDLFSFIITARFRFTFFISILHYEEFACCNTNFSLLMQARFSNYVHCIFIIPNSSSEQFYHYLKWSLCCNFIWIFDHWEHKVLKLLVNLCLFPFLIC